MIGNVHIFTHSLKIKLNIYLASLWKPENKYTMLLTQKTVLKHKPALYLHLHLNDNIHKDTVTLNKRQQQRAYNCKSRKEQQNTFFLGYFAPL